jgi:hypothetical protein
MKERYGLKASDFEFVALPLEQAHAALREGKVDALFRVLALGNAAVSQHLQTTQTKLVPIDQAAALQLSLPSLEATEIPIKDLEQLAVVRRHLFEIFQKVVVDLDKDRISPESFQSFTFPWEVAVTTIRHQELLLLNLPSKGENLKDTSNKRS